ncbi:MAG: acyl-CoA N-acyltransferase [Piptocephalis tieghemiana]|nr:MAG: acyl-CoA N-acyltransferase [Piptocephalis tieghemiana]
MQWTVERFQRKKHTKGKDSSWTDTLEALEALERKSFPKSECMSVANELGKPSVLCWVARSAPVGTCSDEGNGGSSSVLGTIIVQVIRGGKYRIHKVSVAEAHRRHGIGKALMGTFLSWIKTQSEGGKVCDLFVDVTRDPAISLYTKHYHFHRVRRISDYYGPGRDAWYMERPCC